MGSKYDDDDLDALTDDELMMVTGGAGIQIMNIACPHCGKINIVNVAASSYVCKKCHAVNEIAG